MADDFRPDTTPIAGIGGVLKFALEMELCISRLNALTLQTVERFEKL